jgi:hypothetical protein
MDFQHSAEIWRDFPELVPGIVLADGITHDVAAGDRVARFTAIANSRLNGATESELPEIQAWRRAFARMGLKPTQYRCASEALLRRLRKEGTLPQLHPPIDAGHRDPPGRQRRPLPALFSSGLQPSDAPTADMVATAISRAVQQFGLGGCAGRMAQEFGDHPDAAARRMRWVRQLIA